MKGIYYRFLSTLDAITDLERQMIKVSRVKNLNDLFELQPNLRIDKNKRRQLKKVRTEISNTYGMVCFSENWQEPLLWGHYADRNRGIALGFEFISKTLEMLPVTYPKGRQKYPFSNNKSITPSDYIKELGHKKYAKWSYEKEYRFFVELNECYKIEGDFFLKFDNTLKLREIIVGPEHPYKSRKEYCITAKYFIELVKRFNEAELIVARPAMREYKIVQCRIWTPLLTQLMNSNKMNHK